MTGGRRPTRRLSGAAAVLAVLAGIAGCGGGEKVFTAEEFVEAINAEGAAVALGEVITTNPDGVEIRSVTLTESEPSPTGAGGDPHGSGSVLALAGSEDASTEMQRCEQAPDLVCFRAANVVLRFEGLFPEEQARITEAFQAIATD